MKELPVKQLPCIICPIYKDWRLKQDCAACNYYKGSKDGQGGTVIVCVANDR